MKSILIAVPFALLLGTLPFALPTSAPKAESSAVDNPGFISARVTGISPNKGVVRMMLYNTEKTFLQRNGFFATDSAYANADGSVRLTVRNIPFGTYAAAFFQDVNHNGRFDSNAMRVPQEPYAFSNGVRAKWGKPDYEDLLFQFNQREMYLEAKLRCWSDQ